jgi:mRNA-degrading endonuclease RelE of RelBE toxin-antitoxin system
MKVQTTGPFDRDYARLPEAIKDRVDKQLDLLLSNPRHPSLRLKKIRGTEDIWEVRVTRAYRLTLQIAGDTFILRRIGPHDVLRKA